MEAQASIAWDNVFDCVKDPTNPLVDRIPFTVPIKVSWESLAEMLSVKFEQATEKGLEPFQLEALKYKLLPEVQYHSATAALDATAFLEVTFNQFSKYAVPSLFPIKRFCVSLYNVQNRLFSWRETCVQYKMDKFTELHL